MVARITDYGLQDYGLPWDQFGWPVPDQHGFDAEEATKKALAAAADQGVEGKSLTPFLLKHIAEATDGKSLAANVALVKHNARVGAQIAVAYAGARPQGQE